MVGAKVPVDPNYVMGVYTNPFVDGPAADAAVANKHAGKHAITQSTAAAAAAAAAEEEVYSLHPFGGVPINQTEALRGYTADGTDQIRAKNLTFQTREVDAFKARPAA